MGQQEIMNILEELNRPVSKREICELLDECGIKINHILARMIKGGEVSYKELDRDKAREMFKDKPPSRRIRLYYLVKEE
jgi:hypothetical protein